MKKLFTSIVAIVCFALMSFAQAGIDDVVGALRSGNANEMAKYIDDNIEIALPSKTDNYSKSQALIILRDFFNSNGVSNFDVKHKGDNGSSQFCIGTLQTKSGSYRTTFFLASRNGKQMVKEIRFQSM